MPSSSVTDLINVDSPRVGAVVVTFNRRELLRKCLRAVENQTRRADAVLVVDNASTDGTLEMLRDEFPAVEILALKKNVGGAGGFHAGMKHAFEAGFDWLWLMDDDGTPDPDCLELLMAEIGGPLDPAVLLPIQYIADGRFYGMIVDGVELAPAIAARDRVESGPYLFTFVGPLLSRAVIERIGLPIKEFFIWFDDTEYAMRIHRHKMPVVTVPRARFAHDPGGGLKEFVFLGRRSVRQLQAPWKTYYGTRNRLHIILKAHRDTSKIGPFLVQEAKMLIGDLAYEPQRWQRARFRLRGLRDGARGRLGKRT